ncbi:tyrosine-type recombinase/integrase [Candidatus Pyrohabitans sp.]
MTELEIYDHEKRYQRQLHLLWKSNISEANKRAIEEFAQDCINSEISFARVEKYIQQLRNIAEWLGKDFKDATKADIKRIVGMLRLKKYKPRTRRDYKLALKKFYTWLEGDDEDPPSKVRWIKISLKKNESKLPASGDLLTVEERIQIIESARYLRDKAIIACLCDGLRPGELLRLRVGSIKLENGVAYAVVEGKTGQGRVDLIFGTPFLEQWLMHHPFKDDPNAPLWVHLRAQSPSQYIKYRRLRRLVSDVGKVAQKKYGLKKSRVYSYLFRHTRATELAHELTDEEMDDYFRWVPGSPMPSVYVHMSGRRTGKKVRRIHGIEEEDEEDEETFKLKRCPVCKRVNPQHYERCYHCGEALDEKTIYEKKQEAILRLQSLLVENPELFVALQELAKNK